MEDMQARADAIGNYLELHNLSPLDLCKQVESHPDFKGNWSQHSAEQILRMTEDWIAQQTPKKDS